MRKFVYLVVGLVLLMVVLLVWTLANPNRFKPELTEIIRDQTGLQVTFGGDLRWQFWPPIKLEAENVTADWQGDTERPLVRVGRLTLDTALGALLSTDPQLVVNGIEIDDLEVWLIEHADGTTNWTPRQVETPGVPVAPVAESPQIADGAAEDNPADTEANADTDIAEVPWQLRHVRVTDGKIHYRADAQYDLMITHFDLVDVAPSRPIGFSTQARLSDASQSWDIDANGVITVAADPKPTLTFELELAELVIPADSSHAARAVGVPIGFLVATAAAVIADDPPILPLQGMRDVNWQGSLVIDRVLYETDTFEDVRFTTSNTDGMLRNAASIPEFFGGTANLQFDIDARTDRPRWTVRPDLTGIDSKALLESLDNDLVWRAPMLLQGELEMIGNRRSELIASIKGDMKFDGGKGEIDIRTLKQPLLGLAKLFNRTRYIATWPNTLGYQYFVGDWHVDGIRHRIRMTLDNVSIASEGTYDPATERLDMLTTLTFDGNAQYQSLAINPELMDIPIPMRCTGNLDDPRCRLDEQQSKRMVATVLRSSANSQTRAELEKKIDKEVPEEYRDRARGLLDKLGRMLDK
jgi:hypothetical protein